MNLVLSANQDHNGCDESRNRFLVDAPTQARLQLVASARKRLHPQGAVAALIEQLPHIQDARANASESCPQSLLMNNCITKQPKDCASNRLFKGSVPAGARKMHEVNLVLCHPPPSRTAKRQRANLVLTLQCRFCHS